MIQMDAITLRPLVPGDEAFSYQVYASTRAEEMALIPWTEEAKEAFVQMQFELRQQQYRAAYPGALTEMILCGETPAGTMITWRPQNEILLVDIALLARFRGTGIGTLLLQNLQNEGKKIVLHVLKQNPARRLYSRLGFVSVAEDSMYLRMEWNPQ